MPEYDLTSKIAEFLDRHMIFPLLEFLSSRKIYDEKSILAMKLELLNNTNMVDFALDCYRNLHQSDEIPERTAISTVYICRRQQQKMYCLVSMIFFLLLFFASSRFDREA